jgi:hypothetical protein
MCTFDCFFLLFSFCRAPAINTLMEAASSFARGPVATINSSPPYKIGRNYLGLAVVSGFCAPYFGHQTKLTFVIYDLTGIGQGRSRKRCTGNSGETNHQLPPFLVRSATPQTSMCVALRWKQTRGQ